MAADCSFFLSSMAFTTVCAPYCSADGSRLLILPLVKCFHDGLRAILLRQRIAHTSALQQLSRRFACGISLQMAVDCSFFRSSMTFTTVCVPYCSEDGSILLILPLVNSFHDGFRTILLRGWQCNPDSSTRQLLSRRFARRNAQQMASDCPILHSSMAFTTVGAQYFSAYGGGLHILSLVNGFHDGFHAVLLSGWQQIAHTSARRQLS